ncbi:hypothetical protein [Helicobacter pylori]|uniref:hypothetical protein n=1 Tax=Helicobacter pylori TaxID=210 RepID=UPI000EAB87C9|nr:hypothetical protein [Helicobacter pylori]
MRQQNETSKRDKTPALKRGFESLLKKIANALKLIKDALKSAQDDYTATEKKGGARTISKSEKKRYCLNDTRVVFLQDGRRAQKIRVLIETPLVPTTKQKRGRYE